MLFHIPRFTYSLNKEILQAFAMYHPNLVFIKNKISLLSRRSAQGRKILDLWNAVCQETASCPQIFWFSFYRVTLSVSAFPRPMLKCSYFSGMDKNGRRSLMPLHKGSVISFVLPVESPASGPEAPGHGRAAR